jgi:hypothetical protein
MEDLVAAFENQFAQKNFAGASLTLKQLLKADSADPQIQILVARLYDATGKTEKAEAIYRRILKVETQNKLLNQARQGLKNIEDREIQQRRDLIAAAMSDEGGNSLGFLAILPVAQEERKVAGDKLARIFRMDTYTAQLQIPSRYIRIFRIGAIGELSAYAEELRRAGVPAVSVSLKTIAQINVYTVNYFELPDISHLRAVHNDGAIAFDLSEVKGRIVGQIPTFGEIVTVNAKHQLVKKSDILDKIRICDLHLPDRNCILRFYEGQYQFDQGMQLEVPQMLKHIAPSLQERWTSLTKWLDQSLAQVPIHNEFLPFAEMVLAFPEFLKELHPHIDLERSKPSLWDNSFQLYSGSILNQL